MIMCETVMTSSWIDDFLVVTKHTHFPRMCLSYIPTSFMNIISTWLPIVQHFRSYFISFVAHSTVRTWLLGVYLTYIRLFVVSNFENINTFTLEVSIHDIPLHYIVYICCLFIQLPYNVFLQQGYTYCSFMKVIQFCIQSMLCQYPITVNLS